MVTLDKERNMPSNYAKFLLRKATGVRLSLYKIKEINPSLYELYKYIETLEELSREPVVRNGP